MTINSRNKGANFERWCCAELELETGVSFSRNLSQYQQSGLADLTPAGYFPFVIECKRYAKSAPVDGKFWDQVVNAARNASNINDAWPCLIYKFDRQPVMVRIPIAALVYLGIEQPQPGYRPDAEYDWNYAATLHWADFIFVCRELLTTGD